VGRKAGSKNRNYPSLTLENALAVATAIQDRASGMPVSRLTLADLMDRSPSSSEFRELLLASRAYGLTDGGVHADHFELATLGDTATGGDEVGQVDARRKAVLNIEPFRAFLTAYNTRKVPSPAALRDFLVGSADVPEERAEDCIEHLLADARFAGLLRNLKGSEYVELSRGTIITGLPGLEEDDQQEDAIVTEGESADAARASSESLRDHLPAPRIEGEGTRPAKKVFIAHGKNRVPLDQLKKVLDQFKVQYAVAVEEPNKGRPISAKVASLMREECSSAIFIFTGDERLLREDGQGGHAEIYRPSENVVYELGAASVLYDRRIVIFKESGVTFPSDFSDLGYIEFQADQLPAKTGDLFQELVALDVLEVRAKS
jgi:predicted nucleotide-binding protein